MTIHSIHDLGRRAIALYAANKDPLTASAAEILLQITQLPLNEPQENARALIDRQLQAYACLYPDPLM